MKSKRLPPNDIDFIKNILRQGTIKWSGRSECLRRARKKVLIGHSKKGKPKYKYHWQCAECNEWSRDEKSMEVDHVVEIGTFTGDWNEFIKKVYPRPVKDHLQALCVACHMKKTKKFNSARTRWTRKKLIVD